MEAKSPRVVPCGHGPRVLPSDQRARHLATRLLLLSPTEGLSTTPIHSVAGRTGGRLAWVTTRPCRAPHHTISDVGLIGGRQVPMPSEVSLAHHGVLLLDARLKGSLGHVGRHAGAGYA